MLSLSLFGNHKVRISKAHPQSQSFAATKEITTHSVTSWWVGGSCIISMAAISMAVSALWAQASKQAWWGCASLVESTADSATCGQALWNQQPILPCVDKPGGINSRFCQVWTSLAMSHGLAWQNQQLVLPGVDESGEGTPWQNQQPILLSASESLVRIHMVESTADSARCGWAWWGHRNVAESALVRLFTGWAWWGSRSVAELALFHLFTGWAWWGCTWQNQRFDDPFVGMKPEELHFKAMGMRQNLCRISHSN
jgi:hypothetical protein